jgi:Transposase DDE domain
MGACPAERVPEEVAAQRQQRLREYAREHGKAPNPLVLELAHWTIVVTNVPASRLTVEQALALLGARWQIALLFKLWKQHALLDEWQASSPWRILCEVYAKLLAMVVQHWFVLLSCWDDPHHSLPAVAEVLREQVGSHPGSRPGGPPLTDSGDPSDDPECARRLFHSQTLHSPEYLLPLAERLGAFANLTPRDGGQPHPY